jgi:tRNA C32,U32 (ribose-2'-O)-methylase TrmJ
MGDSATSGEKENLIEFIEELANKVKFSNPDQPKKLSVRIRQIVSKSNFTSSEVSLIRGFLKKLKK